MKLNHTFLLCIFGIGGVAVVAGKLPLTDREVDGPRSPIGFLTRISISDTGLFNVFGDRYVDIAVYSKAGELVAEFEDDSGQDNHVDVIRMLRSLRWTKPDELTFRTIHGQRSLSITSSPTPEILGSSTVETLTP